MLDASLPQSPTSASQPPHHRQGTAVEAWAVLLLLLAMIVLPTVGAIARKLTSGGLLGAASYTQHLTLWVAFLGALLATAAEKHLALSTLEVMKPGRVRSAALLLGHFVSTAVCASMAYASLMLVLADRVRVDTLPGGVPEWWFEMVMPVAFAWMALRFASRAPHRAGRAACFVAAAIALPYLLGAVLAAAGHPVAALVPPDGASVFGSHATPFGWLLAAILIVAFLLGAPVFIIMAGMALVLFTMAGTPVASVPGQTFTLVTESTLPAIPLLTVAGYILAEGGASERLVRAAKAAFGWMPGGLAVVAAFTCALFTTFTGASGVTILALGGILYPALVREKYPEGFSLGLVTASGSLGLLFPPSIPVVLYSVAAQVPVDRLYIGGLVPGLLMVLVVAGYGIMVGIKAKTPRTPFDLGDLGASMWAAKWDLGLPLLIVLLVARGYSTVVEAAAIGAAYAILVELLIFRDIHPTRDLPRVMTHAAALIGSVVILLGVALGLTNYMVDADIPTRLLAWVQGHIHHQWEFLLALNVILLVLGSVFEIYSAIVVLAPLVAPLGVAFGVEPVHLGVVFLANLELGFLFPPMGLNLFLSASRFQKPLPLLYRKAMPFLLIMSAGVLLITYWPGITTGVVTLIKGAP